MAKSMVERYEQVLSQDPASTVFVELAKALIEKGEHARAIEVCELGVQHHPESVVGRVLWGKALIHLGRPAQAMSQFDAAIEIERENPHAYNLIGEVLLHKGLYRSALPILKKAIALQPNDGRVRQWYEQAQRALAGGPAPVLSEPTAVDQAAAASDELPAENAGGDSTQVQFNVGPPDGLPEAGERTEIHQIPRELMLGAEEPPSTGVMGQPTETRTATAETAPMVPIAGPGALANAQRHGQLSQRRLTPVPLPAAPTLGESDSGNSATHPRIDASSLLGTPAETPPPAPSSDESDPFARVTGGAPPADETFRGLTSTFDALKEANPDLPDPFAQLGPGTVVEGDTVRGLTSTFDALSSDAKASLSPPAAEPKSGGGWLDDLPPPPVDEPEPRAPSAAAVGSTRRGLLDDLPELAAPSQVEVPKVELSAQATQAMAEEYERELREKIKSAPEKRSFLARHAVLSAVAGVLVLALSAFAGNYFYTRAKNRGQDLADTLAAARKLVTTDTKGSLGEALSALEQARAMDEESAEAWALTAYAQALLAAEHGGGADQTGGAQQALARIASLEGAESARGFVLVVKYLLASGTEREAAEKALLNAPLAQSEVHETAGRILLGRKANERALERFKQALSLSATNVRALVALGGYYQAAGDCTQALAVYGTAHAVSPAHPARTIGAAECRLEGEQELAEALVEVEAIAAVELAPPLAARRELAFGQLLSHAGRHDEALKRLTDASKLGRDRQVDFQLALGQVHARKGEFAEAQKFLESAFAAAPNREEVKEALARVLIARDREDDVLEKIPAGARERRISLVRGIAAARLGQWKKARAELTKTQVDGKFPAEAVVQLTLADAAEGEPERAQEVLEKTLAATRKSKSGVRVALGQVYWQRGVLDKARTQFEEALKDGEGYEGGCSLGRLLLSLGFPDLALEPLKTAVSRNGSHGEARDAYGRALIAVGRIEEGLAQMEAWQKDNPGAAKAHRGLGFAYYHSGKFEEADAALARAVKLDGRDSDAFRLQAMTRFARGQSRSAFSSLERANKLEGDKKDPETFCEIGRAFLRQGRGDAAVAAFEAALKFDARAPCALIGQYAAKLPQGNRAAASELEELAEKTPFSWNKAFANATLARVRLGLGQLTAARKAADEAVKLAPHNSLSQFSLGLVALRQKDEALAQKALSTAAANDGTNVLIRLALADALNRGGDTEKAVGEYETVLELGAPADELPRVKKLLPLLKKKLANR